VDITVITTLNSPQSLHQSSYILLLTAIMQQIRLGFLHQSVLIFSCLLLILRHNLKVSKVRYGDSAHKVEVKENSSVFSLI